VDKLICFLGFPEEVFGRVNLKMPEGFLLGAGCDSVGKFASFSRLNSKCLRAFGEIVSFLFVGDVVGVLLVFSSAGSMLGLVFCPEV